MWTTNAAAHCTASYPRNAGGFRQGHRLGNQCGRDVDRVVLIGEVLAKLHEHCSRRHGDKCTVSCLPNESRHNFDPCNMIDVDEVTRRRGRDTEHPGRAHFAHVLLHYGTAVEEISRHLATLLKDDLGERFTRGFDGLAVLV